MKNNHPKNNSNLFLIVFFIVSLLGLPVLALVFFCLNFQNTAFVDFANYLRLFLDDSIFLRAVFNIYGRAFLFSVVAILIFTVVRHIVKSRALNQAKAYHLVNAGLGSVVSFVGTFIYKLSLYKVSSVELLDAEKTIYNALNISEPAVSLAITPFEVILALHAGVFAAFVFWITELLWKRIKRV